MTLCHSLWIVINECIDGCYHLWKTIKPGAVKGCAAAIKINVPPKVVKRKIWAVKKQGEEGLNISDLLKRKRKKEGHWEMMQPDVQNWHVFNSTKQLEAVDKEGNVEEFRLLSIILVNLLQRILYGTFVCGQISQISNFFKDVLPMRNTKIHCIHCLFIVTNTQSLPPILTYKLAMMILQISPLFYPGSVAKFLPQR